MTSSARDLSACVCVCVCAWARGRDYVHESILCVQRRIEYIMVCMYYNMRKGGRQGKKFINSAVGGGAVCV